MFLKKKGWKLFWCMIISKFFFQSPLPGFFMYFQLCWHISYYHRKQNYSHLLKNLEQKYIHITYYIILLCMCYFARFLDFQNPVSGSLSIQKSPSFACTVGYDFFPYLRSLVLLMAEIRRSPVEVGS